VVERGPALDGAEHQAGGQRAVEGVERRQLSPQCSVGIRPGLEHAPDRPVRRRAGRRDRSHRRPRSQSAPAIGRRPGGCTVTSSSPPAAVPSQSDGRRALAQALQLQLDDQRAARTAVALFDQTSSDVKQLKTETFVFPDLRVVDEVPEVTGATWNISIAESITTSQGPPSKHVDESDVVHADGSEVDTITHSDGNSADTYVDTYTTNANGTASIVDSTPAVSYTHTRI